MGCLARASLISCILSLLENPLQLLVKVENVTIPNIPAIENAMRPKPPRYPLILGFVRRSIHSFSSSRADKLAAASKTIITKATLQLSQTTISGRMKRTSPISTPPPSMADDRGVFLPFFSSQMAISVRVNMSSSLRINIPANVQHAHSDQVRVRSIFMDKSVLSLVLSLL